ncbi:MAG: NDP-sugar synthase [Actinomycetota bacterium]
MKAVVLVGGEGTRMRPLTETLPKPLLPLMGRPFLHHVLDHLVAHGVHEIILSSPYLGANFASFIEERHGDPKITWITETEPLGTGGAVLNALDQVGGDPFFVLNGDILTDLNLTEMLAAHHERGSVVSISTFHVDDARAFGLVITDDGGRILEFREKPEDPIPGDVNAGTYLIDPVVVQDFPRGANTSIEREIFPVLIERGLAMTAFGSDCYWLDLGTPENYLRAHFDILEGRVGFESEVVAPFIDPTAEVDLRSQLGRWVVVGERAVVAEGAEIEDSVVLAGASVGRNAKVVGTVLGPSASVGEDARVDGCVLGEGASVPAGAVMGGEKIRRAGASG